VFKRNVRPPATAGYFFPCHPGYKPFLTNSLALGDGIAKCAAPSGRVFWNLIEENDDCCVVHSLTHGEREVPFFRNQRSSDSHKPSGRASMSAMSAGLGARGEGGGRTPTQHRVAHNKPGEMVGT